MISNLVYTQDKVGDNDRIKFELVIERGSHKMNETLFITQAPSDGSIRSIFMSCGSRKSGGSIEIDYNKDNTTISIDERSRLGSDIRNITISNNIIYYNMYNINDVFFGCPASYIEMLDEFCRNIESHKIDLFSSSMVYPFHVPDQIREWIHKTEVDDLEYVAKTESLAKECLGIKFKRSEPFCFEFERHFTYFQH